MGVLGLFTRASFSKPRVSEAHGRNKPVDHYRRDNIASSKALVYSTLSQSTPPYSHSIVPGGLLVTSYTTRFTPLTSLMIRVATLPRNFMSNE